MITAPAGTVVCPAGHGEARRVFSPIASVGGAAASGPAPVPAGGGGGCCGGACGSG